MNKQLMWWSGKNGVKYSERCFQNILELEKDYINKYGVSRSQMFTEFFIKSGIAFSSKLLEVGCNLGLQSALLSKIGYTNITAIDVNDEVLSKAQTKFPQIKFAGTDGETLPFATNAFDVIFHSGVFIHQNEDNLDKLVDEIYRCSKRYIVFFEYWSKNRKEIEYRKERSLMWADDFCRRYKRKYENLLVKKEKLYLFENNPHKRTQFCLLEKIK